MEELSSKTQEYENLLRDIGNFVDGRTAERIKTTLEKVGFLDFFFFFIIVYF